MTHQAAERRCWGQVQTAAPDPGLPAGLGAGVGECENAHVCAHAYARGTLEIYQPSAVSPSGL